MPHKDPDKKREYHREYQKKWRQTNLEKARAIDQKYHETHREDRLAQKRAYYAEHAEEIRAQRRARYDPEKAHAYYLANKEQILARQREYRKANKEKEKERSRKWYEQNRERKLELDRKWRETNKEYIAEKRKALMQQLKLEVFNHYGGPVCACCGVTDFEFLTIDHIHGNGAKHRRTLRSMGYGTIYRWLKDHNYPEGYRVLCMNCNFALGLYGYCPHQKLKEE